MEKKILFVSSLIPDECKVALYKYVKNGVSLSAAVNLFQDNIVRGFMLNNYLYDVISAPTLPAYPWGYSKLKVPTVLANSPKIKILSYPTFFICKYALIEKLMYKEIEKWIKMNSSFQLVILIYNLNPAFMMAVRKIKQLYPNIITSVIVTDMLEDANNFKANRNLLKKIQITFHYRKIIKSYNFIDKYILLSEPMKDRIPNCNNNYCIVEGLYSENEETNFNVDKEETIFYSGALDTYVNLPEIIEAYKKLKTRYKFVICGDGPLSSYIQEEADRNSNIVYLGVIDRAEVLRRQRKASFLINPRQPSEITKYSFPSKVIEYYASATPVIMYHLQGIPDEYYKYCYTLEGTTVNEIAESLNYILSINYAEACNLGVKARQFVIENKTIAVQVRKIYNFLIDNL